MNRNASRPVDQPAAILAASLLLTMGGLIWLIMPIYAGAAAASLGLDESEVGLLASADFAGIALASILAPFWIRRVNWRSTAGIALVLMLLGNFISIYADTFSGLAKVRLSTSFAAGSLMAICLASLADTSKTNRNFGLAIAVQTIAGTIGLFGLPYLVTPWGVDSIFVTLAIAIVLVSPAILCLTPGDRQFDRPQSQTRFVLLPFLGLIGMLLFFSNIGAVWTYFERIGAAAGLAATFIGKGLALSNLVALGGALAAAYFGDRFGHLRPLSLVALAQLLALTILFYRVDALTFVIALSVYTFFWNYAIPSQMSATANADPSGKLIVLATAFQGAGAAVGPATVAAFLRPNSFSAVYLVASVFCILSLMFFVPVCRSDSQRK